MRRIFSFIVILFTVSVLFSCSSSKKLILKVEEHKIYKQPLTVPVSYSSIADVGDVGYKAELVPHKGYLYIGNLDGEVYRINPKNGNERVVVTFDNQPIEASVAFYNGYMFVGTTKGWLYKVNVRSGKILEKKSFSFPIVGHIYVRNGKIYLTDENDKVYCLDARSLYVVWSYTHGSYNMLDIRGFSGISFGKNGIYVGFDDGSVDKVSYTGDQIWEAQVGQGSMFVDVDTTPLVEGNVVYVVSTRGYTEALKTKDGSLIWKRKISSYSNMESNIFGIFLADENGDVYCLDSSGGETIWKKKLTLEGNIYSLKLIGNILFVMTSKGKLIALDPLTGKIIDIKDLSGDFSSYMTFCCDKLFVVSRDGEVYSIYTER